MGHPKFRPFPESLVPGDLSNAKQMGSRTDRESVKGGREKRGRLQGEVERVAGGAHLSLTGRMDCFTLG